MGMSGAFVPSQHRAEPANEGNTYNRNFTGQFCRCVRGEKYDPMTEVESMVCCIGCQDWFHEGCLVSV